MAQKTNDKKKNGLLSEIVKYLVFGVLTTVVSMASNFGVLWGGKAIFGVEGNEGTTYWIIFSAAKIISWVCAVLFAFFTNKKWVFNDNVHDTAGVFKQLTVFAGGRVFTLGLDYLLNWLMLLAMNALALSFLDGLFGISLDTYNELVAWFVTQVAVVVSNYFISKLFVFKNKTENDQNGESDNDSNAKSE